MVTNCEQVVVDVVEDRDRNLSVGRRSITQAGTVVQVAYPSQPIWK